MSVIALPPTAANTGFIDAFPQFYPRAARSSINIRVISGLIRDVLAEWDHIDIEDVLPTAPAGRPDGYPADEVSAVEFVRAVLRISQERVLDAVGIAERTFFGWKQQGRRPRTSSTGRLWAAVEALYYLQSSHPNLAAWFKNNEAAQKLFDGGQFDDLVRLELDWAIRTYAPTPAEAPYGYTEDARADGDTEDASEPPESGPSLQIKTVTPTTFRVNSHGDHD